MPVRITNPASPLERETTPPEALFVIFEAMVRVLPEVTDRARVPAPVPPAVRVPAPEIVVGVVVLFTNPPPWRFKLREGSLPRSTNNLSVSLSPKSVVTVGPMGDSV